MAIDDPMKKREEFAVNLRKQKTRQIIDAKRMRLQRITIKRTESLQTEVSKESDHFYTGYKQFVEDEAFYL